MNFQHSAIQSPVGEKWNTNSCSVLNRAFVSKFLLNSLFSESVKVIVKDHDEFIYGNALPISTIEDSVFDYA